MKRDQKKWCISFFISLYFCLFSHPIFSIDRSKPPQSGPPPQIKLAKPTTFKLKNGLTVIIVENHKLPSVFIRLDIDNPPHIEGKLAGVSTLLSNMMGNGTKKIPKDKFNEDIDFMGATLRLSSTGGSASCLTRFYPKVMAMMSDAIINPALTESEMIKEKDKLIESLKADEKNVKTIGTRVAAALIY